MVTTANSIEMLYCRHRHCRFCGLLGLGVSMPWTGELTDGRTKKGKEKRGKGKGKRNTTNDGTTDNIEHGGAEGTLRRDAGTRRWETDDACRIGNRDGRFRNAGAALEFFQKAGVIVGRDRHGRYGTRNHKDHQGHQDGERENDEDIHGLRGLLRSRNDGATGGPRTLLLQTD
jgi:hypothetical protein